MATIISQGSKKTITKLIRDAFDRIDLDMDFIYGEANRLIQTAKDYGLTELAMEMENDLKS